MKLEPMSPHAQALLHAERQSPSSGAPDAAQLQKLLGRLDASLGLAVPPLGADASPPAPVPAPAAVTSAGSAGVQTLLRWKVTQAVVLMAAGATVGSGATILAVRQEAKMEPAQVLAAPAEPRPAELGALEELPAPVPDAGLELAPQVRVSPRPPQVARREPQPSSASSLREERAWMDTARAALARSRSEDALLALDGHASAFPGGALAEEREFLRIQVLAQSGQTSAARAKAARFKQLYRDSVFTAAIDAVISSLPVTNSPSSPK